MEKVLTKNLQEISMKGSLKTGSNMGKERNIFSMVTLTKANMSMDYQKASGSTYGLTKVNMKVALSRV